MADNKYPYEEIFSRNIGILKKSEQEKIKNSKILIVGCGGIGGWAAEYLARLGVGKIILADPETFEISNLNRQATADITTIGKNKARVVGEKLRKINPGAEIDILEDGLTRDNVDQAVRLTDFVVDTMDFYSIEEDIMLHRFARDLGKNVFLSQVAGSKATFTYFGPKNEGLDYYIKKGDKVDMKKMINFFFPELPRESGKFLITKILKGDKAVIPSISIKPAMTAAILVEDILDFIVKNKFYSVPEVGIYDFDKRSFKRVKINVK